jgi:hypothetical protein
MYIMKVSSCCFIDFVKWERVDTIDLYYHPEWKYPEDKVPVNLRKPAPIL